MEISSGDATVPCAEERIVRNPYDLAEPAHCADVYHRRRLVALHAFIKKTQKTPEADLQLAQKRQQEIEDEKEKHIGSSIDDFMKEEGFFEEAEAQAIKEVVAWQLAEEMKKQKLSKKTMAEKLNTSRTQINRLLNAEKDITLSSLQRAAALVGRRLKIELV